MKPQPRFVIPGHGQPSDKVSEAIAVTHDYIEYVRAAMRKAATDLIPFDEAYAATDCQHAKTCQPSLPAIVATRIVFFSKWKPRCSSSQVFLNAAIQPWP